jgi:hypothetical protein
MINYRINWHIVPPYVARAAEMASLGGVLYKRGYYNVFYKRVGQICEWVTFPVLVILDPHYLH